MPAPLPPPIPEIPKPELPAAYGTGRLLLAARDPRCIYAHWDLTLDQLRGFNSLSAHHHMVLRVQQQSPFKLPPVEVPLPAEAWHSFVPVPHAGAEYLVELGYHKQDGQWVAAVPQASVLTPPDAPAPLAPPTFATVAFPQKPGAPPASPPLVGSPPVPAGVGGVTVHAGSEAGRNNVAVQGALQIPGQPGRWTATQARALARFINSVLMPKKQAGSMEIPGLIQAPTEQVLPSEVTPLGEAVPVVLAPIEAVSSLPELEKAAPRNFWLNINAELVVYGATEPGAQLTIDGRPVPLRPDGTFTCRFALPDGSYQLAATARSSAGDVRGVRLQFRRGSTAFGEVGVAAPDPSLEPPKPGQAP
jgi:uncharacterized protein